MYLPAITLGYAIPRGGFGASVHSVFRSAINLRLKETRRLVTLLAPGEADLPQGIRLDAPEGFSFERFQTGEQAICSEGILSFEISPLAIQLSGARYWKCDLPALRADPTNPAVANAWSHAWDALNRCQKLAGAEIVAEDLFHPDEASRTDMSHKAGEAMRDLIHATRQYEHTATAAVKSLIGLGPGLTPSGDDLLAGYMAGLWCAVQESHERMQFISSLGRTILHLSRRTNDISLTYLYHAVRGQVSSRLADLAEAVCRGDTSERLFKTAEAAMQAGHTSGMDASTGLLIGIAAWQLRWLPHP